MDPELICLGMSWDADQMPVWGDKQKGEVQVLPPRLCPATTNLALLFSGRKRHNVSRMA
jgi:hypothetical protein